MMNSKIIFISVGIYIFLSRSTLNYNIIQDLPIKQYLYLRVHNKL